MQHDEHEGDERAHLDRLIALRWATDKQAVDAVKADALSVGKSAVVSKKGGTFRSLRCSSGSTYCWFVKLSLTRKRGEPRLWHVTTANMKHMNCTATPRSTAHQLATASALRNAVIADPAVSATALEGQLQLANKLVSNRSIIYRAKQRVLQEVFSDEIESI